MTDAERVDALRGLLSEGITLLGKAYDHIQCNAGDRRMLIDELRRFREKLNKEFTPDLINPQK